MSSKFVSLNPLLLPTVSFIVGILTGDRWAAETYWWGALAVALVLAVVAWRSGHLQSAAILLCMLALGGVRGSSVRLAHDSMTWPDYRVSYEAVVVSELSEKPKTMAADIIVCGDGRKVKAYIAKDDSSREIRVGERLRLSSRIERNSEWHRGTFDYRRYQEVHGFAGRTYVRRDAWQRLPDSWEGLSAWQRLRLQFLSYRHTLLARYRQAGLESDNYAVIAAMTLGDKSGLTTELRTVYSVSGASHVLALSGLHLGIIYMLLSLVGGRRRRQLVVQLLTVVAVWAFVLLVGMPASVVRAAVMISLYALLALVSRRPPSLNTLALTAFCLLMASPDSLFDVGFQLSFAAMTGILVIQPRLYALVPIRYLMAHPPVRWLWGLVTVSIGAQVATAPLVAYYFGRFSTYFLLTNLVAIPAATAVLYLALLTLVVPFTAPLLSTVVGWFHAALSLIALRLPGASIEGLHPSVVQTVLVYVIIACLAAIVVRIWPQR